MESVYHGIHVYENHDQFYRSNVCKYVMHEIEFPVLFPTIFSHVNGRTSIVQLTCSPCTEECSIKPDTM